MIGEKLNQYTFKSILGEGGMATVYLAYDENFKREVAIKLLKRQFVYNDNIRKRFLAEARNMNRMSHKNVVKVLDLIDAGDIVAFVMEFIDGETLKQKVDREGAISTEGLKQLFPQMLEGVEYVHDQGIIHRDIKPSNFMITKDGIVKLTDFGIAKSNDQDASEYTMTGTTQQMGTPLYMSPEQVQSTRDVTKQTDIYSLGVVLWYMITGKKPYDDKTISFFDLMTKIVKEKLPDASHIILTLSTNLNAIIEKATDKDPSNRFSSCEHFKKEFDKPENFILNPREDSTKKITVKKIEEPEERLSFVNLPNGILFLSILSILIAFISLILAKSCQSVILAVALSAVSMLMAGRLKKKVQKNVSDESYYNKFKFGRNLSILALVICLMALSNCFVNDISPNRDEILNSNRSEWSIEKMTDSSLNNSDLEISDTTINSGPNKELLQLYKERYLNKEEEQLDSDNDGLQDDLDHCPNLAGPIENNGCPYKDVSYSINKIIDKPNSNESFGHTTTILNIKLTSDYTILTFENEWQSANGWTSWIAISRTSYIKDKSNGAKLKLLKATGIEISPAKTDINDKERKRFKLYFPRVSNSCTTIDFVEGTEIDHWKAYNIKLTNSYKKIQSSSSASSKFKIGDEYGGGIICYVDETGKHGFVKVSWLAPSIRGKFSWRGAVAACENLKYNGYSDWRLPSSQEIKKIASQFSYITSNGEYWTSTENKGSDFKDGEYVSAYAINGKSVKSYVKNYKFRVIAIRNF